MVFAAVTSKRSSPGCTGGSHKVENPNQLKQPWSTYTATQNSGPNKHDAAQMRRDYAAKLDMKQKQGITDVDPHGIVATRATAKRAIRVIHET